MVKKVKGSNREERGYLYLLYVHLGLVYVHSVWSAAAAIESLGPELKTGAAGSGLIWILIGSGSCTGFSRRVRASARTYARSNRLGFSR